MIRKLNIIMKVVPGPWLNQWDLTLSCGHKAYEDGRKKPSIWQKPEVLGRRRRKRCLECEKELSS